MKTVTVLKKRIRQCDKFQIIRYAIGEYYRTQVSKSHRLADMSDLAGWCEYQSDKQDAEIKASVDQHIAEVPMPKEMPIDLPQVQELISRIVIAWSHYRLINSDLDLWDWVENNYSDECLDLYIEWTDVPYSLADNEDDWNACSDKLQNDIVDAVEALTTDIKQL